MAYYPFLPKQVKVGDFVILPYRSELGEVIGVVHAATNYRYTLPKHYLVKWKGRVHEVQPSSINFYGSEEFCEKIAAALDEHDKQLREVAGLLGRQRNVKIAQIVKERDEAAKSG